MYFQGVFFIYLDAEIASKARSLRLLLLNTAVCVTMPTLRTFYVSQQLSDHHSAGGGDDLVAASFESIAEHGGESAKPHSFMMACSTTGADSLSYYQTNPGVADVHKSKVDDPSFTYHHQYHSMTKSETGIFDHHFQDDHCNPNEAPRNNNEGLSNASKFHNDDAAGHCTLTHPKPLVPSAKRGDRLFDKRLEELKAFKAKYGHCDVLHSSNHYPDHRSLALWCKNIRNAWRKINNNENPRRRLTEHHIQRLNDIGFKWNLKLGVSDHIFAERFKELMQFKVAYGHCNVENVDDVKYRTTLLTWCKTIKLTYQKIRKNENTKNRLTQQQIQSLTDIGFEWDL